MLGQRILDTEVLLSLIGDIANLQEKKNLLVRIHEKLRSLISYTDSLVTALDGGKRYQSALLHHIDPARQEHIMFRALLEERSSVNLGIAAAALASEEPQVQLFGPASQDRAAGEPDTGWHSAGIHQIIVVALRNGKENIGLLYLFFPSPLPLNSLQLQLVQAVAGLISPVVANMLLESVAVENLYLQEEIQTTYNYSEIVGASQPLQKVFNLVASVAATTSTVLILGETGTGKELIARAIHSTSKRKDKLMVKVNCATLPANLIESELFGHERGSFTGAVDRRIGKFELANNSTLFLDEIGELPLDLQVKLLRALQEKEIERIGGRTTIQTDVRIIAATNRDLEKEVAQGSFRSDLYFRLNVFPIFIPPLRDRREDIFELAMYFLHKHAKKTGKKIAGFSGKAIKQLNAYNWPGNVRELEHLIERSVLLSTRQVIDQLFPPVSEKNDPDKVFSSGNFRTIDEVERDHILQVLKACKGKVSGIGGAAEILKIPSTTLNSKIKRLGITKRYRSD